MTTTKDLSIQERLDLSMIKFKKRRNDRGDVVFGDMESAYTEGFLDALTDEYHIQNQQIEKR